MFSARAIWVDRSGTWVDIGSGAARRKEDAREAAAENLLEELRKHGHLLPGTTVAAAAPPKAKKTPLMKLHECMMARPSLNKKVSESRSGPTTRRSSRSR